MDKIEYAHKSTFATLPRTTRGMPMIVGGDPKGKNFLYCNGNSVIIRDIENPAICDIYTEHSVPTTVAKYSPSGFYIASGDNSGKIRIWDTTQSTHILKAEYQPISGAIRDIGWSPDSQRVAVVGEGRERFGHVFLFETGTSNGNLSGQSKTINSVDFRPTRPFRIITASEDYTVGIFEGPPFKFKNYYQNHTRFAHSARYSPDGALFASCGADGKLFLYEGTDGKMEAEFVDEKCKGNAHGGGIYCLSWSPDGKQLLTTSGDKSCKIWDVETKSVVSTFTMGNQVEDQQLSCLWQGPHVLSVSLSGFIHYLDPNDATKPRQIVKGHARPITAISMSDDQSRIYTADMDGSVNYWDASTGENDRINAKIHKSQVQGMGIAHDSLISVAMDDTIACTSLEDMTSPRSDQMKLASQPRGLGVSPDGSLTAVACLNEIIIMKKSNQVASLKVNYEPSCVAINSDNTSIAVGGGQDNNVHIYTFSGSSLTPEKELVHQGQINAVEYSPNGAFLVAVDSARHVIPYRLPDYTVASTKAWTYHTARVNCVAWNANNRHIASGSLDTGIIVWDLEQSGEHPIIIKGAHSMSQITGISWGGPNTVISVGQDSNVKQWTIHI